MSGYVRVSGTTEGPDTAASKSAQASCTGGRVAIGGGYELVTSVPGDEQNLAVTINRATSDTQWSVTALEDDLDPGTQWSLQAFVLCAQMAP